MAVTVKEINYKVYGKCVEISNGIVDAVVTVDVGPRIIRYGFVGKENFMFEDLNDDVKVSNKQMDKVYGTGATYHCYGGHRIWMSPENMPLTYYPDNDPVEWEAFEEGAVFYAPIQEVNEVQYEMMIMMDDESPELRLTQRIVNLSEYKKRLAIWSLTVLNKDGLEIVPQPNRNSGLLHNRSISLWPYSNMADERVYWGKNFITLKQNSKAKTAFKFGINGEQCWGAYLNNDMMFVKTFIHNQDGIYPDNGMSYETFTNNHFIELETLSEMVDVLPGSSVVHAEGWTLFDNVAMPDAKNEAAILRIMKEYID